MSTISIRLPDEIERQLDDEAARSHKSKSEIAREAIADYVVRAEKKRFMAELAAEMRNAYARPDARRAAIKASEDAVDDGLDAILKAERAAGINPAEKWWR
jgi:predicted transcriptional regulator